MVKSPEISLEKSAVESLNKAKSKSAERKKHLSKKAIVARLAGALFVIANLGMAIKHHVEFDIPNTCPNRNFQHPYFI